MRITQIQTAVVPLENRISRTVSLHGEQMISSFMSDTLLTSYQVPAGTIAKVDFIEVFILTDAIPTQIQDVSTYCVYTPSGQIGTVFGEMRYDNPALNAYDRLVITNFGYMTPGDMIEVYVTANVTGGSIYVSANMKITEFVL